MKVYLVGGAVRDQLLGKSVKEQDWVVIGSNPKAMIAKGFKPVGKHFPVFLHPQNHEEYALARTERKVAKGYHGFQFYTGSNVSLEQDLSRRDLTINAMAQDDKGQIIDPYGGQKDIEQKILRHVSPAFAEDPVRLLRLARINAALPDFSVAEKTLCLLKQMVAQGEVNALVSERVCQELVRALNESAPWRFFEVLAACGALPILLPSASLTKICAALHRICPLTTQAPLRFAAAFSHLNHEALRLLGRNLRLAHDYQDLSQLASRHKQSVHHALEKNSEHCLALLEHSDAFRRPQRFEQLLLVCQANDEKTAPNATEYHPASYLRQALAICMKLDLRHTVQAHQGSEIATAVRQQRLTALKAANLK